jgi:hypothetical protein
VRNVWRKGRESGGGGGRRFGVCVVDSYEGGGSVGFVPERRGPSFSDILVLNIFFLAVFASG